MSERCTVYIYIYIIYYILYTYYIYIWNLFETYLEHCDPQSLYFDMRMKHKHR